MGRVWIWEGEGNRGGEEAEEGGRLGEGLAPFLWRERVFFFLFWNLRVRAGASGTGDWVRRVDWVHGGPWAGGGTHGHEGFWKAVTTVMFYTRWGCASTSRALDLQTVYGRFHLEF